jgi:pimeloyl-ACP methyl ester carboxylesterase
MIRHQFKTQDDVTLNAVETGNPLGQAILFVHGLSQSWRSWRAQFADPQLRERFRLLALDLRGHGESQGAFGKAILYASTPVLLPPGTENGGSHLSVRPETIDALLRTYPVNPTFDPPSPNEDRTVAIGLMDFIHLCFADETGRAVSFASIQETMAFNLLTPPQVRLLLGTRWFDSRPLLAGLSDADRQRLMALTPQGDRIFYADVSNAYWAASRIRNVRVQREGHCYHLRSADDFNQQVAAFASSK